MANEKRLIDANEIEELFYKQVEWGATDLMDAFDDALQDAQTVDAVEVVHGRWEDKWEKMWNLERPVVIGWECSVCGFLGCEEFNYCPNCGADMRERKDNERKAD